MKIIMINSLNREIDITKMTTNITWSGSNDEVARKLQFDLVNNFTDENILNIDLKTGNYIKLYNKLNQELFFGVVFKQNFSTSNDIKTITCFDFSIYLLKNNASYNFSNTTAERIARKVCLDFDINKGNFIETGVDLAQEKSLIYLNDTLYNIIKESYDKTSEQNHKKYKMLFLNNKLNIVEEGSSAVVAILETKRNIIESNYSESIENMINKIEIVDGNENVIQTIEEEDWLRKYGSFQRSLKEEDNGGNTTKKARELLQGLVQEGQLVVLENNNIISGTMVNIIDDTLNIIGEFIVKKDEHRWTNGAGVVNLTLEFSSIKASNITEQSYKEEKEKIKVVSDWEEVAQSLGIPLA